MIRKLLNGDIDRVADIWLKTNLKAHYFISNQYWKSNYELVTINEQITKIAQNHPAIIKTSFSEAPCWINR